VIALFLFAFFSYEIFYVLRQVPLSAQAPRVGEKAPEFTLVDQNGKPVALADLLSGSKAVVLIFIAAFGDRSATPSCGVFSTGFLISMRAGSA
jgi:cytochrome oxidase Cu insertion factor (SCO1/SenC/PrrC family)